MKKKELQKAALTMASRSWFAAMNLGSKLIPWPEPKITEGIGCYKEIPAILRESKIRKPCIVTSHTARRVAAEPICALLDEQGIGYELFDGVSTNPTDTVCMAIKEAYRAAHCDGFLAIGGGSPIDAAKAAKALLAHPKRKLRSMKGYFGVLWPKPSIVAVPTTAGSGSEVSLATIVTEETSHLKFTIADPFLIPQYAVIDPQFTFDVPPRLTATTGMDVLTHAVESYLSWTLNTKESNRHAEEAAVRVFRYLERAYRDGHDAEAREQMAIAACKAGQAFSRSGLGYVHAIAHKLGGVYNTPHGLANAVLLPIVLEDYGEIVYPQLAHLAEICGIRQNGTEAEKARAFIAEIRAMNKRMELPTGFDFIREGDIDQIVKWAVAEGAFTFTSPVVYDYYRCRHVINRLIAEA